MRKFGVGLVALLLMATVALAWSLGDEVDNWGDVVQDNGAVALNPGDVTLHPSGEVVMVPLGGGVIEVDGSPWVKHTWNSFWGWTSTWYEGVVDGMPARILFFDDGTYQKWNLTFDGKWVCYETGTYT